MAYPSDNIFLPLQYGDTFDFTLAFEHGILTILPTSLFLIAFPILFLYYARRPIVVASGWLLWQKITMAVCLLCVDVSILVLWVVQFDHVTALSIAASSLSCATACCIVGTIVMEHRHSYRPSSFLSLYFAMSLLCDATKARSCLARGDTLEVQGALFATTASLKGVLLFLQEVSKRAQFTDAAVQESLGVESTSGFWNRSLFVWLNRTLFMGYRKVLEVEDLDELGPEFSSTYLNNTFKSVWSKAAKDSPYALAKACFTTLALPTLAPVVPRLCFTAFTFLQPVLLQSIVRFVEKEQNGEQDPKLSKYFARGLVGATVLVYLGIAITRAIYTHFNYRLVTMTRGLLVSQILIKSLALDYTEASKNSAMTLMSTDIEGLATGLPELHDIWMSFIEVGIGIYLLSITAGKASFLVIFPLIASTLMGTCLGKPSGAALARWNEQVQHRVSQTVLVLKHIKGIKMLGLDSAVTEYIQHLRIVEIGTAAPFRMLASLSMTGATFAYSVTPVIVIAGALFWTNLGSSLNAEEAFTTLAVLALVVEPLLVIIKSWPTLVSSLSCVQRIQAFLLLEEHKDYRTLGGETVSSNESLEEKSRPDVFYPHGQAVPGMAVAAAGDVVIHAQNLTIKLGEKTLLYNASFTIPQSTLTILTGSVGSGKSVLLRALLGEVKFEGSITYTGSGIVAYCDQTPWLRNESVRDNIIGESVFDPGWYDVVVDTCLLTEDLLSLPNGDETFTGSEGVSLSGGQKQRVALARALYSRAPIFVLDDVLSGLDVHTSTAIVDRLFGDYGLLKRFRTTVIMASYSAYCAGFASQIISLDGAGQLTVTDAQHGSLHRERLPIAIHPRGADDAGIIEEEPVESINEKAEQLARMEAQEDRTLRRKGDLALYAYYFRSTTTWMALFWLLLILLVSFTEVFPTVYIRIWLETAPKNNLYFLGYALIALLNCALGGFEYWFFFIYVVPDFSNTLHHRLLQSTIGATMSFLTETDSGVMLNRFSQDISLISQNLPRVTLVLIYIGTTAIMTTAIVLSGARYTATILPLILLVLYVIQHFYLRTSRQMRYLDLEAKTPLYTHFAEAATGLYHIRGYGITTDVLENGIQLLDISQKPFYYLYCIQRWLALSMDFLALGVAASLVAFSVLQMKTSQTAIGLSLVKVIGLSEAMGILVNKWTDMETSLGAIARLRSFINDTPRESDPDTTLVLPESWPQRGHIVFSNLTATYSSMDVPNRVLHGVSIEIPAGAKCGIIGRTGSGKSSLLLATLNFLEYTGSIYIDGLDISKLSRRSLRSQITTITQDPVELDGTVRYNLLSFKLARNDSSGTNITYDAEAVEILCRVRLWGHISDCGGLDASMADLALSGGQKQLLSIARALLHNQYTKSKIVLMDEATSNIDIETDAYIQTILSDAFQSCTVVMIAHRLETLSNVDSIIEMADGRVIRYFRPG